MMSIVAVHTGHGGFNFPAGVTFKQLWLYLAAMGGLGNSIFVMLSGYFLINSKGIKIRRLCDLCAKAFFWSTLLYCLFVFSGLYPFDLKEAMKNFMPITHSQWWFASTYAMLYLIHPYLNRFLHGFTQEEYKHFLKTAVLGWCVLSLLTQPRFSGADNIINFVCLYSVAGYLRLYGGNLSGKKYILYALAVIGINFLPRVIFAVLSIIFSLNKGNLIGFILGRLTGLMSSMMSPTTILATVCIIVGFRSLNIPHSKFINTIASATFGVYLIHDNNFVRPFIWKQLFRVASYQDSPYFIPYITAVILTVFISCTVLDLIRSKIFRTLTRGYLS